MPAPIRCASFVHDISLKGVLLHSRLDLDPRVRSLVDSQTSRNSRICRE